MAKVDSLLSFRSVQWFCKKEWTKVYMSLFGPDSDDISKNEALQLLLVWKMRNPYLVVGIESTLALLEVDLMCKDDDTQSTASDRMLRVLYSSALMRFLNHALSAAQLDKLTIGFAAAQLNIPNWIVSLRHETAHGHELPSLDILKNAAHFALNWLHDTYWRPESIKILDYYTKKPLHNFGEEFSLFFSLHNSLLLFRYRGNNNSNLNDIPSMIIRDRIMRDFKKLTKSSPKPNTLLDSMLNILNNYLLNLLNETDDIENRNDTLCVYVTDRESLFMIGDDPNNFSTCGYVELNEKRVILWDPFLRILHKKNIISTLFFKLIDIANDEQETRKRREPAAKWLREISIGLNKCRVIRTHISEWSTEGKDDKLRKRLHRLLLKKYPHMNQGLTLHLPTPVPLEIANVNILHKIVSHPHWYLSDYISAIMTMMGPVITKSIRRQILTLLNTFYNMDCSDTYVPTKIYTVNNIENEMAMYFRSKDIVIRNYRMPMEEDDDGQKNEECTIWKKINEKYDWGSCPIGILPWQKGNPFNLI